MRKTSLEIKQDALLRKFDIGVGSFAVAKPPQSNSIAKIRLIVFIIISKFYNSLGNLHHLDYSIR